MFSRFATAVLLFAALAGLCVWFGTLGSAPAAGVYPENEAVIENPETHLGELVDVHGRVVATDPVTIQLTEGDRNRVLEVQGVDTRVQRGDVLAVYGRLETPTSVTARAVVVTEAHAYWRTRVLSLVAGLAVVVLGARYWTINTAKLALVRRGEDTTEQAHAEGNMDA